MALKNDCLAEIKRFFRCYFDFCENPKPDAIIGVITSSHSLNDKLRKAGYPNFFKWEEFLAIKAIRNYAIHHGELYNDTKSLPLISTFPIEAELRTLCLLSLNIVKKICDNPKEKEAASVIGVTCIFYKKYVDIYPCIFNFGVKLFLYTEDNQLGVDTQEYLWFRNSIEYERKNGFNHLVKGGIKLINGSDIDAFLDEKLLTLDEKKELEKHLYTESSGMYTLKGFD